MEVFNFKISAKIKINKIKLYKYDINFISYLELVMDILLVYMN